MRARSYAACLMSGWLGCLAPLSAQLSMDQPIVSIPSLHSSETFLFSSSAMNTPKRALDILEFWFGSLPSPDFFPEDKINLWFATNPQVDQQIHEYFFEDVQRAAKGELNFWRDTPRGRLALILLLDQFPRHLFRDQAQAYTLDPMARGLVLEGMQKEDDKFLYPIERAFLYLPLEHAEDLDLQNQAVQAYQRLVLDAPLSLKPQMEQFHRYAVLHRDQIVRFGRFPHRNVTLGRKSTVDEALFLTDWGKSSF